MKCIILDLESLQSSKKLCTRYTLGLSATLYRSDGLTKVIKWYSFNVIYKEEKKK